MKDAQRVLVDNTYLLWLELSKVVEVCETLVRKNFSIWRGRMWDPLIHVILARMRTLSRPELLRYHHEFSKQHHKVTFEDVRHTTQDVRRRG